MRRRSYVVGVFDTSTYHGNTGGGLVLIDIGRLPRISRIVTDLDIDLSLSFTGTKLVTLALYGFHHREHGRVEFEYLKMLRKRMAKLVEKRAVETYAIIQSTCEKLETVIRNVEDGRELKILVADRPSSQEERCLDRLRRKIDVIYGKTHVVGIADVLAYYAAVYTAYYRYTFAGMRDEALNTRQRLEELKRYILRLKVKIV